MELVPFLQGQLPGCLPLGQAQGGLQGTAKQGRTTLQFTALRELWLYIVISL